MCKGIWSLNQRHCFKKNYDKFKKKNYDKFNETRTERLKKGGDRRS